MTDSELPKAPIVRVAKNKTGLRVGEDAKNMLLAATEKFIENVAEESSSHEFFGDKRTLQGKDVRHILNEKRYKRMIPEVEDDD